MPAGSYRFELGAFRCTVLSDGYGSYPSRWWFPNANPAELAEGLARRGSAAEQVVSPYTCLLVESGREVMLVDAGLGGGSATSGAIVARLEMAGVRPRDITTVLFTHAHPDHVGGAIEIRPLRDPAPRFPNARYVIAEAEWDFWTAGQVSLSALRIGSEVAATMQATACRCLQTLRHQVELIGRETEVIPGVRAIPAPGHTPGHLALHFSSEGRELINLGDAAVHPLHLEHPDWHSGFDLDAQQAIETRRSLMERAAASGMHVMAFHFPFPSLGRLAARTGGGWEWTPGW